MYSAASIPALHVVLAFTLRFAILTPMRIAEARKNADWTQAKLAAALGVSRGAVAQWEMEGGTRPDPTNALRLTELLPGLTLNDIYTPPREEAA
jgi:DNA-binding XRE family transcriptional regulator